MKNNNRVELKNILIKDGSISYSYIASGAIADFFNKDDILTIDYGEDMSLIPDAVSAIVFVANLLPLIWLYDAELVIPKLDKSFYESIDAFKNGFIHMYPKVELKGHINVISVVDCSRTDAVGDILFFSGGVDAVSSLVRLIDDSKNPILMTLWGADIDLSDTDGWMNKTKHTKLISKRFNLDCEFVKTNFRTFIKEGAVDRIVQPLIGDGWWHGLQHGVGIISHAAPYAYKYNIKTVYIASSYTKGDIYTCASDPSIDNYIKFGSSNVVHDGYELTRQEKVQTIGNFITKKLIKIPLIVCWESTGGVNCGHCEKCMRTAAGLIVEGYDPEEYSICGFDSRILRKFIFSSLPFPVASIPGWNSIKRKVDYGNSPFNQKKYDISWIKEVDFNNINNTKKRLARTWIVSNLRKVIKRVKKHD